MIHQLMGVTQNNSLDISARTQILSRQHDLDGNLIVLRRLHVAADVRVPGTDIFNLITNCWTLSKNIIFPGRHFNN